MTPSAVLDRLDRFQQRHALLGFPLAVRKKYSEDHGGYLAATIAYYGFFSLFPLLLVLVTALGYLLHGRPHLEKRILATALAQLPVIGPELTGHALRGNPSALAIGIVASLWTGMGVLLAAEHAMGVIWDVPKRSRFGFLASRLRALGLLAVFGGSLLVTSVASTVATAGGSHPFGLRIGVVASACLLGFCVFWLAFRLLTPSTISWRVLRGGAVAASVGYEALQLLGSYYVTHTLKHASNVYGTFAVVIGLLSWIYLTATAVLLAAEGNVVATRNLWPRSLRSSRPSTGKAPPEPASRPDRPLERPRPRS
jgi:YihY family inner membrane protein